MKTQRGFTLIEVMIVVVIVAILSAIAIPSYTDYVQRGKITEAIREVVWTGGPLPDDQFEEFKVQMKLPDSPNATVYFPVVQECQGKGGTAEGINRWIEIPEGGKSSHDLKLPAPGLKLRAK